jgi:hypothetical protein
MIVATQAVNKVGWNCFGGGLREIIMFGAQIRIGPQRTEIRSRGIPRQYGVAEAQEDLAIVGRLEFPEVEIST